MKRFDDKDSKGRRFEEKYDIIIDDPFKEDYCRLLHSKSVRRLADKTQVVTAPHNIYVRTRRSHTDEVIAVGMTISRMLGLNTDLIMSIALAHDVGHTPYGHLGEDVLSELAGRKYNHNTGGVTMLQQIEKIDGKGLNLSFETLEGIVGHSKKGLSSTGTAKVMANPDVPNEYNVVMYSDKIAYTTSDLNDAMRLGYVDLNKLPDFARNLGKTQDERNYGLIKALVQESRDKNRVEFSEGKIFEDFTKLREFMLEEVYLKMDHEIKRSVLESAYEFFDRDPSFEDIEPEVAYLVLTDKEANQIGNILVEQGKISARGLEHLGIMESLSRLRGKEVDIFNADLEWGMKK